MIRWAISVAVPALLLCGCLAPEERAARSVACDPHLFRRGKGTPYQFISDQCGYESPHSRIVRHGRTHPEYDAAVRKTASFAAGIQTGRQWREPSLTVNPTDFPLRLQGEFPLGSTDADPEFDATEWTFTFSQGRLILHAEFADFDQETRSGRIHGSGEEIYAGDCLEWFLRPDLSQPDYYEILVNLAGDVWILHHRSRHAGRWQLVDNEASLPLQVHISQQKGRCRFELSLPENILSREFSMMPVRVDRRGDALIKRTPVPFLYDGHNVYGYIQVSPGSWESENN